MRRCRNRRGSPHYGQVCNRRALVGGSSGPPLGPRKCELVALVDGGGHVPPLVAHSVGARSFVAHSGEVGVPGEAGYGRERERERSYPKVDEQPHVMRPAMLLLAIPASFGAIVETSLREPRIGPGSANLAVSGHVSAESAQSWQNVDRS